jgi:hypothetical protein
MAKSKWRVMKVIPFDIERLADGFKSTIDWMLERKYGEELRSGIQQFKDNKDDLSQNPDSETALRHLIELFVTQGRYYSKPGDFDSEMDSFIAKHGTRFRTPAAQEDLVGLVGRLARPSRIVARAKKNTSELLTEYSTIGQFTDELHKLAKEGKKKMLGEKGRDNYLRDFGRWDRIPMDRHEMRFIIRTGIYHTCNIENRNDPLRKSYLHDALTSFCSTHLKGKMVEGIDLSSAPGIVDIFIWTYCSREGYNICGSTSKCDRCNLKGVCLYALASSSK